MHLLERFFCTLAFFSLRATAHGSSCGSRPCDVHWLDTKPRHTHPLMMDWARPKFSWTTG